MVNLCKGKTDLVFKQSETGFCGQKHSFGSYPLKRRESLYKNMVAEVVNILVYAHCSLWKDVVNVITLPLVTCIFETDPTVLFSNFLLQSLD